MDIERLAIAGHWQSGLCAGLGAPTWAAVIDRLLEAIEDGTASPAVSLLLDDEDDPLTSNVWLRFLGAVHRVVLDGSDHELAAFLPTAGGQADPQAAAALFDGFVSSHRAEVAAGMAEPVQTNEVMRSAPLAAGLNWIGGDLTLLEVGASAGLNLWSDRYRVETVAASWGPEDATLILRPDVEEGTLPEGPFRVVARHGCDRRPLDPTDGHDRRLLRSFVWPDHVERLDRLDAALESCPGPVVEEGDATGWIEEMLRTPAEGRTVLFHSIVMPYFTDQERSRFESLIRSAGATADSQHRLAWLRMELDADAGRVDEAALVIDLWPENTAHRLAWLTPHATSIRWAPERIDGH